RPDQPATAARAFGSKCGELQRPGAQNGRRTERWPRRGRLFSLLDGQGRKKFETGVQCTFGERPGGEEALRRWGPVVMANAAMRVSIFAAITEFSGTRTTGETHSGNGNHEVKAVRNLARDDPAGGAELPPGTAKCSWRPAVHPRLIPARSGVRAVAAPVKSSARPALGHKQLLFSIKVKCECAQKRQVSPILKFSLRAGERGLCQAGAEQDKAVKAGSGVIKASATGLRGVPASRVPLPAALGRLRRVFRLRTSKNRLYIEQFPRAAVNYKFNSFVHDLKVREDFLTAFWRKSLRDPIANGGKVSERPACGQVSRDAIANGGKVSERPIANGGKVSERPHRNGGKVSERPHRQWRAKFLRDPRQWRQSGQLLLVAERAVAAPQPADAGHLVAAVVVADAQARALHRVAALGRSAAQPRLHRRHARRLRWQPRRLPLQAAEFVLERFDAAQPVRCRPRRPEPRSSRRCRLTWPPSAAGGCRGDLREANKGAALVSGVALLVRQLLRFLRQLWRRWWRRRRRGGGGFWQLLTAGGVEVAAAVAAAVVVAVGQGAALHADQDGDLLAQLAVQAGVRAGGVVRLAAGRRAAGAPAGSGWLAAAPWLGWAARCLPNPLDL
uniref:Protein kinase domain-containing protein n=1 Tax=Macrostomum lignano TaxID=282301 RepID=A0A1I8FEB5_9PLAT